MEASIVAEQVDVREKPDAASPVLAQLVHGTRVILGDVSFKKAWVEVRMMDGRRGFIPGNTPVRSDPMSQWLIGQTPWEIRATRDPSAAQIPSPPAGEIIACGAVSKVGDVSWTEVKLRDGQMGYIAGEPVGDRLVWVELPGKQTPLHEAPESVKKVASLGAGHILAIAGVAESSGKQWARAILPGGGRGFLPPSTPIIRLDPAQGLPNFRTLHATCGLCRTKTDVHMITLHLTDRGPDDIYGAAYVPACRPCLKRNFWKNLGLLTALGIVGTIITFAVGLDFIGMVAFAPLALYFMNTLASDSKARRFRQLCTKAWSGELAKHNVQVREPVETPEDNMPEKWADRPKWIVCPGCLELHREQEPWCPKCSHLFFWKMSPLV